MVADPLQARAVALAEGEVAALLVVLSVAFSAPLRLAIARATGVPAERVLTSCTHTHSGPDLLLGMDLHDGYANVLASGAVAASAQALARLEPVAVGLGAIDVPTSLAVNRRRTPHTPRLQLVDLQGEAGRVASLVGVGIHPVTHGPDVHVVTAGWIGHCRTAVQDSLGAPAVVVSGALGDVNPPGGDGYDRSGGGVALAREVGTAVAALAVRAADRTAAVGDGLVLRHRTAVERPGPVLPVGLAPTWQGYLPHPDAMTGGYEDDLGLGAPSLRALLDALAALAPA